MPSSVIRHACRWWYEGGGLIRHMHLVATDPVHVEPFGAWVHTNGSTFFVETTLENHAVSMATATIAVSIFDLMSGAECVSGSAKTGVPAGGVLRWLRFQMSLQIVEDSASISTKSKPIVITPQRNVVLTKEYSSGSSCPLFCDSLLEFCEKTRRRRFSQCSTMCL